MLRSLRVVLQVTLGCGGVPNARPGVCTSPIRKRAAKRGARSSFVSKDDGRRNVAPEDARRAPSRLYQYLEHGNIGGGGVEYAGVGSCWMSSSELWRDEEHGDAVRRDVKPCDVENALVVLRNPFLFSSSCCREHR
ncbi:hypothetical protein FB45DRAFT_74590 [Roridomyces roridus]|uniref:Uncharacterized protein n=1 Tax=Roridomyces roridus TaxID=1738132 RepID=A0AAD7FL24_9AGAR|nr:hypothetical protein FB45DRAFT_74590 [Roridomyces roridus]